MHIAYRTDASVQIGTGHVMRCLTLADALRECGGKNTFICRSHDGHLLDLIARRGHSAVALPVAPRDENLWGLASSNCATWLGVDWFSDAVDTRKVLGKSGVDWLVVDHYALDCQWENVLRDKCQQIMVIDDLANRSHDCDLLLDQNLGRTVSDYANLVPEGSELLTGPKYALLRPEFSLMRKGSVVRQSLRRILIFFGGSDPTNETLKALRGVLMTSIGDRVDVVIGSSNPHRNNLEEIVAANPGKLCLHVQTERMAELMANADLAIGAGGSASWERCCLRLPSLVSILADNQAKIAQELHDKGAAINLGDANKLSSASYAVALAGVDQTMLTQLSENAGLVVDGLGVNRIVDCMCRRVCGETV